MTTTQAQANAALARQLYGLFNEAKLDEILPLAAPGVEVVLVPFGQTFHGREGFVNFLKGFKGAFPDLQIQVMHQVATEDHVVSEFTARGTHTGPLLSPAGEIPPTGRTVDLSVCEVWRVENGRLASLHNYQDAASLLRQLGVMS